VSSRPGRVGIGVLALLHGLLLIGAPLADAALDSQRAFGPHFEEVRSECLAYNDHFCCAFCRLLATHGTLTLAPRVGSRHVLAAASGQASALDVNRSAATLPLGPRAPPRS
jgi:hypothetical protein